MTQPPELNRRVQNMHHYIPDRFHTKRSDLDEPIDVVVRTGTDVAGYLDYADETLEKKGNALNKSTLTKLLGKLAFLKLALTAEESELDKEIASNKWINRHSIEDYVEFQLQSFINGIDDIDDKYDQQAEASLEPVDYKNLKRTIRRYT